MYRISFVLSLILIGGTAFFCQSVESEQGTGSRPPTPVEVARVEARTVRPQLTLLGDVEAFTEGDVHSEVEGLIEKFPVKEGDFVKAGEVLAELNSSQLDLLLAKTREDREQSRVLYEKEQREFHRFKTLSASSSVSRHELEREMSEAESSKYRQRMLDVELKRLEDLKRKKTIRAPFDGYVVAEHVHRGTWVQEGGKVVRMVRVEPVYVTVPFPQKDLPQLRVGDAVEIRVDGLGKEILKGTISAVIARGDTASRTFRVKIRLDNPGHRLKPGMLAYATFRLGKPSRTLMVPKDAVVITPSQQATIFLVVNGKTVRVPVETGRASGSFVEVSGKGLKEDQMVVTVGNERLRSGEAVQVIGSAKDRGPSSPLTQKENSSRPTP